jgi:hypothetical protein
METPYVNSQFSAAGHASSPRISKHIESQKKATSAMLTGCVSKLSVVAQCEPAYFDALKDYAVHYAQAQAYLADDKWQIAHDYSLMDGSISEPDHGLLGDDGEPVKLARISDDDIDYCGYMGWLRH